ncbi:MAG: GDP-mannose 4,6-dehydratase [Gemmatimonadaceae bacterium]
MSESVLITGAAGFIGSHVVDTMLDRGCSVAGLDNFDSFYDPAIKRANLARALESPRFSLIEADVRDAAAMRRAMKETEPDVVVHLAARAGVRPSIAFPALYADVNIVGTTVLLESAREAGVRRVVNASSSSVYGNASKVPFSESDSAVAPISPYAATKRAAELVCESFSHLYPELRLISLRFFTVYGPRQRPDLAIHKFARLIEQGSPVPLFGDGSSARDYTYITDTLAGVVGAIERTRLVSHGHETFNLGASATTTLSELVSLLEDALGKRAILEQLPDQPGDVRCTYADVTRARSALGYSPSVPIRVGIKRFAEWFRSKAEMPAGTTQSN